MFRLLVVLMVLAPILLHAQQEQSVPAYLLEIPESVGTILIAETASSTLHKFQAGENGATRQGESYMSVAFALSAINPTSAGAIPATHFTVSSRAAPCSAAKPPME